MCGELCEKVCNIESFIENAKTVHGDHYDYSKTKYSSHKEEVEIVCNVPGHGSFMQRVINHLAGREGCRKCINAGQSLTTAEFIIEAIETHKHDNGDALYDYSETVYTGANNKVKIICRKHGVFEQRARHHVKRKHGCRKCADEKLSDDRKLPIDVIIKRIQEIHGDKYDCSLINYINNRTKIKLRCKIHDIIFEISPDNLLYGECEGCPECIRINNSECRRYTKELFIQMANEVHGIYDYNKSNYIDMNTKIEIKCNCCNNFFILLPIRHIHNKQGCPYCTPYGYSDIAIRWLEYISKKNNIEIQHAENGGEYKIGKYKVDGWCEETNTCYEFNGSYWHGNPKMFDSLKIHPVNNKYYGELYINTLKKEMYLLSQGYKVVSIWEDEWNVIEKSLKKEKKLINSMKIIKTIKNEVDKS